MRRWIFGCTISVACTILYVVVLPSCGGGTTPTASSCTQGDGAWFQPASDPNCCAPLHNQFICPVDADPTRPTCVVTGKWFRDDAGAGQRFPVGCVVDLTYCNSFYEGQPQTCSCDFSPFDSGATWSCGI